MEYKMKSNRKKTCIERIVQIEHKIRPAVTKVLPNRLITFLYSTSRKYVISQFAKAKLDEIKIPDSAKMKLWDIDFNCGLFNAAGMFKDGEGYYSCAKMGAGAYIAGTTTNFPRDGNSKHFVKHPFMPYPASRSSSNWMGMPNKGHEFVANELSKIQKIKNCPIGISIAGSPETVDEMEKVKGVVEGFKMFEKAGVDFIELNNSCPNIPKIVDNPTDLVCNNLTPMMVKKLTYISENFLQKRTRNIPVIVKYSNDFNTDLLLGIVDLLIELGFDGINIGNTSTDYERYSHSIIGDDKSLFRYFTDTFGGGLSGEILKDRSLFLSRYIANYIKTKNLHKEFHCIRTGGVSSYDDIVASQEAGVFLNEWFSGFWDNFAKNGFETYRKIFRY
jgi:dihydroorotate dehydrogenase